MRHHTSEARAIFDMQACDGYILVCSMGFVVCDTLDALVDAMAGVGGAKRARAYLDNYLASGDTRIVLSAEYIDTIAPEPPAPMQFVGYVGEFACYR